MRRASRVLKVFGLVALLAAAPPAGILLARRDNRATVARAPSPAVAASGSGLASASPELVGVLLPPMMANLSPRADGRILSVPVKLGQNVRAGDVLVSFDPREKRHDLAMAKAQLAATGADAAAAHSELDSARKRYARRNTTVEVGGKSISLVSAEEAAQANSDAQSADARVASAWAKFAEQRAKVEQLHLALEETELHAPFDGVVTALNFGVGTTAHTGDVIARVVGGTGLRVRIAVPEELAELMSHPRARLTLEDRTFSATIDQRATEVEPASRAFLVEGTVGLAEEACGGDCALFAGRAVRVSM